MRYHDPVDGTVHVLIGNGLACLLQFPDLGIGETKNTQALRGILEQACRIPAVITACTRSDQQVFLLCTEKLGTVDLGQQGILAYVLIGKHGDTLDPALRARRHHGALTFVETHLRRYTQRVGQGPHADRSSDDTALTKFRNLQGRSLFTVLITMTLTLFGMFIPMSVMTYGSFRMFGRCRWRFAATTDQGRQAKEQQGAEEQAHQFHIQFHSSTSHRSSPRVSRSVMAAR